MKKLLVFLFALIAFNVFAQEPAPVPEGNWYDVILQFLTVENITAFALGLFGDRLLIKYRAGKLKETFNQVDAALEDSKVTESEYKAIWATFKEVFKKRV